MVHEPQSAELRRRLTQQRFHGVSLDDLVLSDEHQGFRHRLGDEHPIERVAKYFAFIAITLHPKQLPAAALSAATAPAIVATLERCRSDGYATRANCQATAQNPTQGYAPNCAKRYALGRNWSSQLDI